MSYERETLSYLCPLSDLRAVSKNISVLQLTYITVLKLGLNQLNQGKILLLHSVIVVGTIREGVSSSLFLVIDRVSLGALSVDPL